MREPSGINTLDSRIRGNDGFFEATFSRFRRMHFGQAHRVSPKYLDRYAHEIAYREDTRREPNGWIFPDIARRCVHVRTSRDWCGYWQGNQRVGERLAA